MRSAPRAAFAARALALLSLFSTARAAMQNIGCYSSSGSLVAADNYLYQTKDWCAQKECSGQAVIGLTNGNGCLCGNSLPPASSKVDATKCNIGCTGFGTDSCGGNGYYTIWTTGSGTLDTTDSSDTTSDSSSASSSSSSTPTQIVVTSVAPGHTVIVTQSANAASTSNSGGSSSSGGGSNVAGIAAGVVVGIVAFAAIIGGVYFWLRRRRQLAVEAEHRQKTQVSDFISGSGAAGMSYERKGAMGSSYSHRGDARLDPEAGGLRRNSVGSFVEDDSQDYSRKILRVANPDSS